MCCGFVSTRAARVATVEKAKKQRVNRRNENLANRGAKKQVRVVVVRVTSWRADVRVAPSFSL